MLLSNVLPLAAPLRSGRQARFRQNRLRVANCYKTIYFFDFLQLHSAFTNCPLHSWGKVAETHTKWGLKTYSKNGFLAGFAAKGTHEPLQLCKV